jgi:PTS system mannose-specific IID component
MFVRLLAIQGSWNYETLLGNGIGFCIEPALRLLPAAFHSRRSIAALRAREQLLQRASVSASVAVGALARAELDGEARSASSVSDGAVRPARQRRRSARLGRLAAILFAGVTRVVWTRRRTLRSLAFLVGVQRRSLRAAHLGTEYRMEPRSSRRVRAGKSVLRRGPQEIGRLAALATGIAIPLALGRIIGPGRNLLVAVLIGVAFGALVIVRLQGRIEGWRLSLVLLAGFALFSVIR